VPPVEATSTTTASSAPEEVATPSTATEDATEATPDRTPAAVAEPVEVPGDPVVDVAEEVAAPEAESPGSLFTPRTAAAPDDDDADRTASLPVTEGSESSTVNGRNGTSTERRAGRRG
jgi:hypothetical protein